MKSALAHSIAKYPPAEAPIDVAKLIAQIPTPVAVSALRFQTAADLAAGHQVAISYVLPPYLIAGALTDLTGAAKVGKTRLRNFLIRCALTGACCLDRPPAAPTRVVLLTEEPLAALLEELRAAGLADRSDLLILTRFEARGTDWPAMVAAAIDQVKRHDAGLLVVDTLPGMARLEADSENSAGHALAALRPLQEADTPTLAKLLIRHTRKAGGTLIEAGRGSSAFAGEADVLVSLTKPKGTRPSVRRLEAVGRFDAVPPVLTVERLQEDCFIRASTADPPLPEYSETYVVVDRAEAADPESARLADRLVRALPTDGDEAVTIAALAERLVVPDRSIRHALDQLGDRVRRIGAGTRGAALKFFIPANPDHKGLPQWNNPSTQEDTPMAYPARWAGAAPN